MFFVVLPFIILFGIVVLYLNQTLYADSLYYRLVAKYGKYFAPERIFATLAIGMVVLMVWVLVEAHINGTLLWFR